jgi:hypothetical protein
MKTFQTLRSPAIPFTFHHDLPVFLMSSSTVLRHVFFGLPLLLYPWSSQSNAVFSIAPASLRNLSPIQFHFLLYIWISIGFCLVILHSSSFVILSIHFIFSIRLKHLSINVCSPSHHSFLILTVNQASFISVWKLPLGCTLCHHLLSQTEHTNCSNKLCTLCNCLLHSTAVQLNTVRSSTERAVKWQPAALYRAFLYLSSEHCGCISQNVCIRRDIHLWLPSLV